MHNRLEFLWSRSRVVVFQTQRTDQKQQPETSPSLRTSALSETLQGVILLPVQAVPAAWIPSDSRPPPVLSTNLNTFASHSPHNPSPLREPTLSPLISCPRRHPPQIWRPSLWCALPPGSALRSVLVERSMTAPLRRSRTRSKQSSVGSPGEFRQRFLQRHRTRSRRLL